jgi:hypothetical protein
VWERDHAADHHEGTAQLHALNDLDCAGIVGSLGENRTFWSPPTSASTALQRKCDFALFVFTYVFIVVVTFV